MDSSLKKKLRALSLALRHTLEGSPDQAGDLESRLNQMGVWKDRPSKPVEELRLSAPDLRRPPHCGCFPELSARGGDFSKGSLRRVCPGIRLHMGEPILHAAVPGVPRAH